MMDIVDGIIKFESGEMDEEEVVEFFQMLLDTNAVCNLQGFYHRTSKALLDAGLIETR